MEFPFQSPELDEIRAEHRRVRKVLRSYEVIGRHAIFGAEPGSIVELTLSEGEERGLVEAGHLVPVDEESVPTKSAVEEVTVSVDPAAVEAHQDDLSQ